MKNCSKSLFFEAKKKKDLYLWYIFLLINNTHNLFRIGGGQWLSGRVLDSRARGCGFEPHRHHCVVVLEQDTFILA